MRDIKVFLANLSHHPGVYQMLGEGGEVLYVGKAKNLKKRISAYFGKRESDLKTASLIKHVKDIDFTVTYSENEAVLLECNLIKKHRPRYNVLLRDDKSYPYIMISIDHPYPRIDLYRGSRKKNALYFGPYPSAYAVRETISLLQKVFGIRTCKDNHFDARNRPCLLYQIGRCTGACAGLISKEEYAHNVELAILFLQGKSHIVINELQKRMETAASTLDFEKAARLRNQIMRLRSIQEKQYINVGVANADIIGQAMEAGVLCIQLLNIRSGQITGSRSYFPSVPKHATPEEITRAFITQHYLSHPSHIESTPQEIIAEHLSSDKTVLESVLTEQAKHKVKLITPVRGEKNKWLHMALKSAQQSLTAHLIHKTNVLERMRALKNLLGLRTLERIECFDISHTMGEATVASCVVFDQSGPLKKDYRRFNIKNVDPGNDIAAMQQVLFRRFKRIQKEDGVFPDLVLIDGGSSQLQAAEKALDDLGINRVQMVAVSKGVDRKPGFETLHRSGLSPLSLPADDLALHFIQQIRDEAHRFAITGHRARRDKKRSQSTLELIPGIGKKRRRELLRYFGGIQGLAHASLEELTKVPGISQSLAERIFATLHDTTV